MFLPARRTLTPALSQREREILPRRSGKYVQEPILLRSLQFPLFLWERAGVRVGAYAQTNHAPTF
jgi:hypothetical protein